MGLDHAPNKIDDGHFDYTIPARFYLRDRKVILFKGYGFFIRESDFCGRYVGNLYTSVRYQDDII